MPRWLTTATFRTRAGTPVRATYEHPWLARLTHWLNAIAITVMAASGLQILRAFPAFGPKIPEHDVVTIPRALALGGWLAGGLQWHFTFMWIFMAAAALYVVAQVASGRYLMVLFRPRDLPGVWPMVRHYFLFGPKPPLREPYNPLQKLAYTGTLALGGVSLVTGLVLYKPAQFSVVAAALGGFRMTRIWHFAAMCGLLAFVPGHLAMVALHGWNNFAAMLIGWKREPEYLTAVSGHDSVGSAGPAVLAEEEIDGTADREEPEGGADPEVEVPPLPSSTTGGNEPVASAKSDVEDAAARPMGSAGTDAEGQ